MKYESSVVLDPASYKKNDNNILIISPLSQEIPQRDTLYEYTLLLLNIIIVRIELVVVADWKTRELL